MTQDAEGRHAATARPARPTSARSSASPRCASRTSTSRTAPPASATASAGSPRCRTARCPRPPSTPNYEQTYGAAIGQEFAGKGVNVALGPTINMVRDPRWGRAVRDVRRGPVPVGPDRRRADVQGIQSQGVMAEVKHAAAYNIEQPAGTIIVSPRTLQEIYLPAFQTAIEKGGAAARHVRRTATSTTCRPARTRRS